MPRSEAAGTFKRESFVGDAVILLLCAVAAALTFSAAFSEGSASMGSEGREPERIGIVQQRVQWVRRRLAGNLVWETVVPGEPVHQGDAMYVGTDSEARVSLDDGSVIDIEENSLVVLQPQRAGVGEAAAIEIVRGVASPIAGASGLTVTTGKGSVSLAKAARAQVRKSELGVSVAVEDGTANVRTEKGESLSVRRGERSGVDGRVQKLDISLESPGPRVYFVDNGAKVLFSWALSGGVAADSGGPFRFELSRDAGFSDIVADEQVADSSIEREGLEAGLYYWRVRQKTAAGEQLSREQKVNVIRDVLPVPYQPAEEELVDLSGGRSLRLAWTTVPYAIGYQVRFGKGTAASAPEKKVDKPSLVVQRKLQEGAYCYQVRIEDARRTETPWSKERCFRVILKPVLEAPTPTGAGREVIEVEESGEKKPEGSWLWYLVGSVAHARKATSAIVLRWASIPGATAYRIEIAEDETFDNVVVDTRVKKNYYSWRVVTRRNYYWRVRAIDDAGREGEASKLSVITAEVAPPTLLAPPSGERIAWTNAAPRIDLRWRSSEIMDSYVLEISSEPSFSAKATRKLTVTESAYELVAESAGQLYWRVTGIAIDGQPTGTSDPRALEVYVPAPKLAAPADGAVMVWTQPGLEVELSWSSRPVGSYEVEVAPDPRFGEGSESKSTKGTSLAVVPKGVGVWHWRVRGLAPRTAWSSPHSLEVRPDIPRLAAPADGAELQAEESTLAVSLAFEAVPGATGYELELTPAGQEVPITVEIDGGTTQVADLTPGAYGWRVIALGPGVRGEPSERRTLSVLAKDEPEPVASTVEPAVPEADPEGAIVKTIEPVVEPISFSIGPRVAFVYNLGPVVAPRFGVSAQYHLPVLERRLGIALSADYYFAGTTVSEAGGSARADFELHGVPVELVGFWTFETPWVDVHVGGGPTVVVSYIRGAVQGSEQPSLGQVTVDGGGLAFAETTLELGPGTAFFAVSFALISTTGGSLGDNDPGGLTVAAGYRLGVF